MREAIDLYAKLLIGTFSFIGPSFSLLIPLFYSAIQQSQKKHNSKLRNLQLITSQNITNSENFPDQIKRSNREIDKLIKQNNKEINLLKPRRQVRRLFISLFSAISFVGFYYFQRSHFWRIDSQSLRMLSIIISGLSFVYCLRVLWQIFCTIIRIKTEEKATVQTSSLRRAFNNP
jgi:hypothetical protein